MRVQRRDSAASTTLVHSSKGLPPALGALWRAPSVSVARLTLASYARSGWLWGEVVFVLGLYAIFFLVFGGDMAYFYGTATEGLGALAILGTAIMVHRALGACAYLPLARLSARAAYTRGLLLASGTLRVLLFVLLLVLVVVSGRVHGATVGGMLVGAVGLLADCLALAALTVALSPPIATRLARIVFLAWLVLALYSSTGFGLLAAGSAGPLAAILAVIRLPLLPLAACYSFGIDGRIGWYGLWALIVVAAYIAGWAVLADRWLAHRDFLAQ
jgi:hypothetical protein